MNLKELEESSEEEQPTEIIEETKETEEEDLEGLYDLVIPPGVTHSLIIELVNKFDLEPVKRIMDVSIIENEVKPSEVLVLRGDKETVDEAHEYLLNSLKKQIEEMGKPRIY
ncbi:MAG: hypothetical protein ACE5KT_06205 [Methanosarcinales archaeon]